MKTSVAAALALGALVLAPSLVHNQTAQTATLTFHVETREVTAPALAMMPDGQHLVFTALGHLHQMPIAGGQTTQLTFGASYDTDPAVSPDGRRIAFTSNRDGSGSNIFVLDVASKRVVQISHDEEGNRAAWSPDGRTIAYARNLAREAHPFELIPGFADSALREVLTVPSSGGQPTVVAKPQAIETIFYLPDGRLGWSVRDLGRGSMMGPSVRQARLEVREPSGSVTVLASAPQDFGRVAVDPKGLGFYYVARGSVQFQPTDGKINPVVGPRVAGNGARIAIGPDASVVYFSQDGGIWHAALPSGTPQPIAFTASITVETRPRVEKTWQAPPATPGPAPLRPVLAPAISPDGKRIAFIAAGLLFEQPIAGGAARQLVEGGAFSRDPAYSPDGKQLAYVASENGKRTLRVYDFATKQTKVLFTTGGAEWPLYPSWSPDGQRIVFQHSKTLGGPFPIVVVNVADGTTKTVTQTVGSWVARPHFSHDGRWIYFTNRSGKIGNFNRISADAVDAVAGGVAAANAAAASAPGSEVLTDLSRHVNEGLASPDGKWMAERRNTEVWIAPLGGALATPIRDAVLRRLSTEGGRSFTFAPDSSAVVYTSLGHVWRQPLSGGARVELPVRVSVPRAVAPPLLVTRVKVLDLAAGRFSDDTSIFVEGGRIRWIGSEAGRQLPANTVRLDGGGRFAIPGLFDAHVHSAWQNQQTSEDAFIAFGVTSVRDTGGTLDTLTALDDRSDITALPAPRYFYSGEISEGMMPLWGDAFTTLGTEAEARARVRYLKAAGADFVKIYPSVPWKLQGVIADEAHKVGLPIVGHGLSPEETLRRIVWGSTSVEHTTAVFGAYDDIYKLLAATGTATDLTLSVGGGALMRASDPGWLSNWRILEFVPEEMRRNAGGGPGRGAPTGPQTRDSLLAQSRPNFNRMLAAEKLGVPMNAGTDSMMGGVYFGLSLHWEIAQYADAGIPAIDVLRLATEGGARLVGASADLGSLTPGKLGDIVLLDASPLENIRNTQQIWQVVKGGRVYDPAKLRPSTNR